MQNLHLSKLMRRAVLASAAAFAFQATTLFAQTIPDVPVSSAARVDDRFLPRVLLGRSIDLDGDLLISGYGQDYSGADIFRREATGWVFDGTVSVGGVDSSDNGLAVAIDGNRVVVGAPYSDADLGFTEDIAIWERQGSSWVSLGQLGQQVFNRFGESVDISGDTVMVGAPNFGTGRIAMYEYDGTTWTEDFFAATPTFSSAPTALGTTVAIQGDVAVAGAFRHPTEQLLVYRRSGTTWSLDQALGLIDFGTLLQDGFVAMGGRVALDGNTILTTAAGPAANPNTETVICVLEDTGSGFEFQYSFAAHDRERFDFFGGSLALEGDTAVIAAERDDSHGSVYLFTRTPGGVFEEQVKFTPTGQGVGQFGPGFGSAVDISGDSIAIGAEEDNSFVGGGIGTIYVIDRVSSPSTIQAFCAGNGGAVADCTDCPCNNNSPPTSLGGCLNAAGTSAILSMYGEARASGDTMRLEVTSAAPSSLVLLVSSAHMLPQDPVAAGCPRGSGVRSDFFGGLRCIGDGLVRHGTRSTDDQGNAGDANDGWGGPFAPAGGLVSQGGFAMGQNRFFQAIYRDLPSPGCNTGLNTTNAIAAMVIP